MSVLASPLPSGALHEGPTRSFGTGPTDEGLSYETSQASPCRRSGVSPITRTQLGARLGIQQGWVFIHWELVSLARL